MASKKSLERAYRQYASSHKNPISRREWYYQVTRKRQPTWSAINDSYLEWRKSEDFKKWECKQFLDQGGTCYYCDDPLWDKRQNVEHIIPKSKGGGNEKTNLVLACSDCNKKKYTTLLSMRVQKTLKQKNKRKRGTYKNLIEAFDEEYDEAVRLREMFRD